MNAAARIAVTTVRQSERHFSMGTVFDFEDAFCRAAGANLVQLPEVPRSAAVRQLMRRIPAVPKCRHPAIDAGLDLLVVICMVPNQVTLDYIRHWRRNCRRVVLYLFDCWPTPGMTARLRKTYAEEVDLLVVSFFEARDYFRRQFDVPIAWMPQAISPHRFRDQAGPRGIFAAAMGRQDEAFFGKLRSYCGEQELFLMFQGEVGGFRRDWESSYDLYADILRHSRYILNWAGKHTHRDWERRCRIDPPTCRWFEAGAAGGVQVGVPPASPEFPLLFPENPVLDVRDFQSDPASVFAHLEQEPPDARQARTHALSQHILARHTWYNRVYAILAAVGMEECFHPPPLEVALDLTPLPEPAAAAPHL